MHEARLVNRLIVRALEAADGAPVDEVRVMIGGTSHVTSESLISQWEVLTNQTPLAGAQLVVSRGIPSGGPNTDAVLLESITLA